MKVIYSKDFPESLKEYFEPTLEKTLTKLAQEGQGARREIEGYHSEWEVQDITAEGVVFKTPTGIYLYRERQDGSLERLQRLGD